MATAETVTDRVAVARSLTSSLRDFVSGLSADQLARASACSEWQVIDVVSHLVGGAERQLASVQRGRAGQSGPPEGFVPLGNDELSATNAQRDIERRQQLEGGILDAFDSGYAELYEELDQFGPDDWSTPCWHLRRGAMPAADYVDLRIQELAIHDWDIRSAFDPDASINPQSLPALLDMSPAWLGMCFRPSARLEPSVVFRFDLAADGMREVPEDLRQSPVVTVDGDRFDFSRGGAASAGLVAACNVTEYLLFTYGRRTAAEALASGRLSAEGDTALLDRFGAWFRSL